MNDRMARLLATKTRDDEWWSSFVTSPLAILINYAVVDVVWLTPNIITGASFVIAVAGAGLIVLGGTTAFVIAAILIHLSHVFDCMDGQMARYRLATSATGSYYDRVTDQAQVGIWFGAVGYAAYEQSQSVLPVFLAFVGFGFYSLRGYTKYVEIHVEMSRDSHYLERNAGATAPSPDVPADRGFDLSTAAKWFIGEQPKILQFNEGVFVFMLSLALVVDRLTPMLWVFAASQAYLGIARTWQRGRNIQHGAQIRVEK